MASAPNPEAGSASYEGESGSSFPLPITLSPANPVCKRPSLPPSFFKFPIRARLKFIQQYISSFEYKQTPQTSYNSHKLRPLARIMDTAKMMIYNPQPIKCVEAVFLALYLTAGIADTERIPLGFKSELHGQVHQHIVLLVRYNNKYGAFGISRQQNLMNRDFEFESLSSIVDNFKRAYEKFDHKVIRIRVGLPVEHNIDSFNFVCWRYLSLDPSLTPWQQCSEALEKHNSHAKRLWERWLLDGQRENRRADMFLRNLETQHTMEIQEVKSRNRSVCSPGSLVKAAKRGQEPDKQEPMVKVVKRRQALQETPSTGNITNQTFSCKIVTRFNSRILGLPHLLGKRSPRAPLPSLKRCSRCHSLRNGPPSARHISEACEKKIKKVSLKCHSMELFPGSGSNRRSSLQSNRKTPEVYPDENRKQMKTAKGSLRKWELEMPVNPVVSKNALSKIS